MLRLHVVPAQGAPFDHELRGDSLVIGRSSSSDLALADRFLSRHHARLFRDGDRFLVEDLGSRNGTTLNGQPVLSPTPVAPGDVIRISGSVLSVQRPEGEPLDGGSFANSHTVFRPVAELLAQDASRSAAPPADHQDLERYAVRLRLLNEVHQALGSALGLEDLLHLILERLFEQLHPEHGGIYLRDATGRLQLAAGRGAPQQLSSQHLIREVTERKVAALVLDAQNDARFAAAESLLAAGVRSLLAAPLLADDGNALGMVILHSNAAVKLFCEEDLELLVSLASVAAMRLRNVALAEEAAQRRVLEEELALARRIQERLLPAQLPQLSGWDLFGHNIPSRHVSGDLYQAILRRDAGQCAVMIADVAGKGVAASLLTASVEALAAAALEDGLPPAEACARVSRLLYQRTPLEKYATAIIVVLQADSGRVDYANAGHNPALLLRADAPPELLPPTGVPLGALPAGAFRSESRELAAGDTLVLYTDGITEATDAEERELGIERFTAVCLAHRHEPLPALARAIAGAVAEHAGDRPRGDDQTLVLLRRTRG